MASSIIDICNYALSHLAISNTIASFTEKTNEAAACGAFYNQVRDMCLRDFPWNFATVIVDLALVENTPNVEWAFSYQVPNDCLRVRRILNGVSRREIDWTRIPYRVVAERLLWTDLANAQLEYTQLITDSTQYPPDFVEMLSLSLAGHIAPRVTRGDQFKLGDRAIKLYEVRREAAQINDLSEERPDIPRDSDMINTREGPGNLQPYYPPNNPWGNQ